MRIHTFSSCELSNILIFCRAVIVLMSNDCLYRVERGVEAQVQETTDDIGE